jgi:hypothetical protein
MTMHQEKVFESIDWRQDSVNAKMSGVCCVVGVCFVAVESAMIARSKASSAKLIPVFGV